MSQENKKPELGERVMWEQGRKDYVTFGEIGTVIGHTEEGLDVDIDDEQPYYRSVYGAKSKRGGHARLRRFTTDTVIPLSKVYLDNAQRFRSLAAMFEKAASEVNDQIDATP